MRILVIGYLLLGAAVGPDAGSGAPGARALEHCIETMLAFDKVRMRHTNEPEKSNREAEFRALLERHRGAPTVYPKGDVWLRRLPPPSTATGVPVGRLDRLSVLDECGDDWQLASKLVPVREEGFAYFETGFVQRADLQQEAPSCQELTAWLQLAPYHARRPGDESEKSLYVGDAAALLREGPSEEAAVLQKLGYGVELGVVSRACDHWVLVAAPHGNGFVPSNSLRETRYDEVTLGEKLAQAASLEESAFRRPA